MNEFFFSDAHFGHKLMCKTRNFETIEEHDETIIKNFNSKVGADDLSYFLGDWSWTNPLEYLYRLNGRFVFINGNHDGEKIFRIKDAHKDKIIDFTFGYMDIWIEKIPITLCHFPMLHWEKSHFGAWHLFGHNHGSFIHPEGKVMNVTLDNNNLFPVSWEEVKEHMKKRSDNPDLIRR